MAVLGQHRIDQRGHGVDVGEVARIRVGAATAAADLVAQLGQQFLASGHEQDRGPGAGQAQRSRAADPR